MNRNHNGILNLPSNVEALNILTGFDTNDQKYATGISINLSELNPELHLEANQNKVLTQETEQFEIYDYEKDDDLDIREKPTNSPLNTKSTRLITLKNGTRDIIEDDPTYRNIGSFSVTAPLLSSIAISKSQSQFNISDYNQNNNTNYLGVKSIVLTAPEYTACDIFIPTQTTNENMDQNNHLITSQWDVYTQNGTSNIWQLFDPTNTDMVTSCWYDNQYLNVHFTGTGTPLIPNKLIYKYNNLGFNGDNNRYHRYHIVLIASDDNVDWTTLLDIDFDEDPTIGDREYYNENANQIEIPINNYHGYSYYQFKTMTWDGYYNQFTYWNLLNCHSEQETPTTINNYDGYTVSSPFQINSTGTGTISIPNGYTGLGNVNYNVNVPTVNNYTGYTASSPLEINFSNIGEITIPNGYTGLGNINYKINKLKIYKLYAGSYFFTKDFDSVTSNNTSIFLPAKNLLVEIEPVTNNTYGFYCIKNKNDYGISYKLTSIHSRYKICGNYDFATFYDTSDNIILQMHDEYTNDSYATGFTLSKKLFDIDF